MNDFLSSLRIAATGLHAQTARMRVIAENLANADSAGKTPDEDPYRRRIPTFKAVFDDEVGGTGVEIGRLAYDMSDFETRYEPGHPAADEHGYVRYPNVNPLIETMDMREAQRTYEANLNVVTVTRADAGPHPRHPARLGRTHPHGNPVQRRRRRLRQCREADFHRWSAGARKLAGDPAQGGDFAKLLADSLQSVVDAGKASPTSCRIDMVNGKANVVDVVTAVSQTEIAIESMVAVRDRVISAYEEIMRMPI